MIGYSRIDVNPIDDTWQVTHPIWVYKYDLGCVQQKK